MSDAQLEIRSLRIVNNSLLVTCNRWAALAGVWHFTPWTFGAAGWLLGAAFADALPLWAMLLLGLGAGLPTFAIGVLRLRRIRQMPTAADVLPDLEAIQKEARRRHPLREMVPLNYRPI